MAETCETMNLDLLVGTTHNTLLVVDKHGVIRTANDAAAKILSNPTKERIGRPAHDLIVPDGIRRRDWDIRESFQKQKTRPIHVVHGLTALRGDGTHVPADLRRAPVSFAETVLVTATLDDVTNETREAARKERMRARLTRLFSSRIAGAAVVDLPSGTVIGANDTLLEWIGYDRDALESGQIQWEPLTPAAHRQHDRDMFERLATEGAAPPYETHLVRADGGRVPVAVAGFLAPAQDTQAIIVVVDRTQEQDAKRDLARANTRLEDSQRLAHVGSAEWAPLTNETWWTEEVYRLFDVPSTAGILDYEIILQRIHPDDRKRVDRILRRAAEQGDSFDFEHRVVHRDGSVHWLHNRGSYVVGADDRRLVGVCQDITDRKRAGTVASLHLTARQELVKLEEMGEFRARFVGMAAHELKNPLSPLAVELHLLRTGELGPVTEKQQASLDRMQRSYVRLRDLTEDMLDASRLHAGRLNLVLIETDVSTVVLEAVDVFSNLAEREQVTLEAEVDPDIGATIDFRRISQVLTNLLANAIKFTPARGTIRVVATTAGDDVRIEVHDTGVGLDESQLGELFAPFKQVHDHPPKGEHGTGLGLYVSKGIVEQHGGQIHATSGGPGQGSVFAFTVPQTPPEPQQETDSADDAETDVEPADEPEAVETRHGTL